MFYVFISIETVEHVLPPNITMFPMGLDPMIFTLYSTALPTELKEISTKAVGRGGCEPTTDPIFLGRGSFR